MAVCTVANKRVDEAGCLGWLGALSASEDIFFYGSHFF